MITLELVVNVQDKPDTTLKYEIAEWQVQGSCEISKWVTQEDAALKHGLHRKRVGNDVHCDGMEMYLIDAQ